MVEITEDEWKVVEERAKELPEKFHIGILGEVLTKSDLLEAIKRRDEIGRAYARMQLKFLSWSIKQAMRG